MYSFEITDFIEQRNHNISNEEYFMLTDPKINPQVVGCEHRDGNYHIWTNDGNAWDFNVYKVERTNVNNNEQNDEECLE